MDWSEKEGWTEDGWYSRQNNVKLWILAYMTMGCLQISLIYESESRKIILGQILSLRIFKRWKNAVEEKRRCDT